MSFEKQKRTNWHTHWHTDEVRHRARYLWKPSLKITAPFCPASRLPMAHGYLMSKSNDKVSVPTFFSSLNNQFLVLVAISEKFSNFDESWSRHQTNFSVSMSLRQTWKFKAPWYLNTIILCPCFVLCFCQTNKHNVTHRQSNMLGQDLVSIWTLRLRKTMFWCQSQPRDWDKSSFGLSLNIEDSSLSLDIETQKIILKSQNLVWLISALAAVQTVIWPDL